MAGNIQNYSAKKMQDNINSYYGYAINVHKAFGTMYETLKNLPQYWTGKRVNQVITLWNDAYPTIDEGVHYFLEKIVGIMMTIGEQYAQMELGKPVDANLIPGGNLEKYGTISKLPLTDANTIKFDKANVENSVKVIEDAIANAKANLNNCLTSLEKVEPYSDSLKSLVTNHKATAPVMITFLDNLSNSIVDELKKAISDVNATEGFNEADAKRANKFSSK